MRLKFFLFIFLMLGSIVLMAQSGTVIVDVSPSGAVLKIDDQTIEAGVPVSITAGQHTLRGWKLTYDYVEKEIQVVSGETLRVSLDIPIDPDYDKYLKDKRLRTSAIVGIRYVATPIYLGFMGYNLYRLNNLSNEIDGLREEGMAVKDIYDNSVDQEEILSQRDAYRELQQDHDSKLVTYERVRRQTTIIGIAGGVAIIAANYLTFQLDKPIYDDRIRLSLVPLSSNHAWAMGACLKLNLIR